MLFRGGLYGLALVLAVTVFANVHSRKARQTVLLISSYVLYISWGAWFVLVLLVSTGMNYALGRWLRRKPSGLVLSLGILLNLVLLSTFKYLPEVAVASFFPPLQRFSHLVLPLGISFWTFQAMSYLFDLYREEEIDPSFVEFALYMVFFPVAISGPICRLTEMLLQFRSERTFEWSEVGRGLSRIATGVLMIQLGKLLGRGILAGDGINSGFDHLTKWSGPDVWCLAFGYGLQLFFDFAGYSHIAIGGARILGITVPENFDVPFSSTTPSIFWTRWHMSLSFWIRDYVFVPLAIVRREMWWRNSLLVVSMVLFGLWHKATVLFVLWGCYHGLLLLSHRQVQAVQRRLNITPPTALWVPLSWIATASLVSLGWIFFRANSLSRAKEMMLAVLSPASYFSHNLSWSLYLMVLALAAGYMIVLLVSELMVRYSVQPEQSLSSRQAILHFVVRNRWYWIPPLYVLALFLVSVVVLTQGDNAAQFMYRGF